MLSAQYLKNINPFFTVSKLSTVSSTRRQLEENSCSSSVVYQISYDSYVWQLRNMVLSLEAWPSLLKGQGHTAGFFCPSVVCSISYSLFDW